MIILIDESGIHAQTGHSTIALVYVEIANLEQLEKQILKVEQAIGIYGFHWAHRNWKIREQFITGLAKANFKVKLALLSNPVKIDYSMEEALQHLIIEKRINQIMIDGSKPKRYTRKLKKVLRDKGVSVKKLRAANDQAIPALRLADAIAGLSRYHHDKPEQSQAANLYKQIEPKIDLIIQL